MSAVVARKFLSKIEADLAAEHLASRGIAASVSADDAGGMLPMLQGLGGVSVLVDEADVDLARTLLERKYGAESAARPPLSPARRLQGILGLILFAVFVVGLVVFAITRSRPPQ